jgi:hypothetical protein
LFTGVYGSAWAIGSIVIGVLASVAMDGLTVFCSVTELAAIPPILAVSARTRHATPARRLSRSFAGRKEERWMS